jgi:hypothetical protein
LVLNKNQFKGFENLRVVLLNRGELDFISFDFTESSNMRELYIRNMPNLKSISPVKASIMGTYLIESTGIEKLPLYMFAEN